jgi:DNA-binding IclR family transcriptional regulator
MSSIQSIERAFSILEAVAAQSDGVGVTEIANRVDLPKSTVSRMLATLDSLAVVERLPDGEGVRLGPKILALALQVPYSRHLAALARPYLLELAEATGEAVGLCLPDGDQVFYIDQVQSRHHLQVRDWTGSRFPLHVVSSGKVLLAAWEEAALARYLERPLAQYTPKTIADPAKLRQQLVEVRREGCCWAIEEFEEGLNGVSGPVYDQTGQVVAALNIYGPAFRFPRNGDYEAVTRLLLDVCGRMSAVLKGG